MGRYLPCPSSSLDLKELLRLAQARAHPWFGVAIRLIEQSGGFVLWEDKVVFSDKASYTAAWAVAGVPGPTEAC